MGLYYTDSIDRIDFKLSKRKDKCEKIEKYEEIAKEINPSKEYFTNQYKTKIIKTAVKMK